VNSILNYKKPAFWIIIVALLACFMVFELIVFAIEAVIYCFALNRYSVKPTVKKWFIVL
jgi:hypothetical protein